MFVFNNNSIIVDGVQIRIYHSYSNSYMVGKFIVDRVFFNREDLKEYCFENDIPINSAEVEISKINKASKEKLGKPFVVTVFKYPTRYQINPCFISNKILYKELAIPQDLWDELEKKYSVSKYEVFRNNQSTTSPKGESL